jgi:hypothetical protein
MLSQLSTALIPGTPTNKDKRMCSHIGTCLSTRVPCSFADLAALIFIYYIQTSSEANHTISLKNYEDITHVAMPYAAATTNNKRIERTVRGRRNFKDLNILIIRSLYGEKNCGCLLSNPWNSYCISLLCPKQPAVILTGKNGNYDIWLTLLHNSPSGTLASL